MPTGEPRPSKAMEPDGIVEAMIDIATTQPSTKFGRCFVGALGLHDDATIRRHLIRETEKPDAVGSWLSRDCPWHPIPQTQIRSDRGHRMRTLKSKIKACLLVVKSKDTEGGETKVTQENMSEKSALSDMR